MLPNDTDRSIITADIQKSNSVLRFGLSLYTPTSPSVLILGSFPSLLSLERAEYYGNPRNMFWKIVEVVLGIDSSLAYEERMRLLNEKGVALWDAAKKCQRTGSSDSSITEIVPNDIAKFVNMNKSLRAVVFNGKKSYDIFRRCILNGVDASLFQGISLIVLPSTSPANAMMSFEKKVEMWSVVKEYLK